MKTYEQRIAALEAEGLTTSDAQAVVESEDKKSSICIKCGGIVQFYLPGDNICRYCAVLGYPRKLGAFDAYVQDEQERKAVQEWNEYRTHGGKLDLVGWMEKQEHQRGGDEP